VIAEVEASNCPFVMNASATVALAPRTSTSVVPSFAVNEKYSPLVLLTSLSLDKIDQISLYSSSKLQNYSKDKILNVSICSNQFQIDKLSRGESPITYNK
jgi:hypothetical protein